MMKHFNKNIILFLICMLFSSTLYAMHESGHNLTDEEWDYVKEKVDLLDELNYMPTLLPVIMKNRDVLLLTKSQIASFRSWRKQHYGNMIRVMNEIIEKRIAFKVAVLNLKTTNEELVSMQNDILDTQRKLLEIKLSCRKTLFETFTAEQWDNFVFVLSDHPKLASFIQP